MDLLEIGELAFLPNHVPKCNSREYIKHALLRVEAYAILSTSFKNKLEFGEMRTDVAADSNFVEEEFHEISKEVLEDQVDNALIRRRCVL